MSTKTHWKKLTNPNYMGDYSIPPGEDLIAIIDYVKNEEVTAPGGKKEKKNVVHFSDGNKPMVLNSTNQKTISKIYGTPYIEDWKGRAIQIYFDANVKMGREIVGGLRIRQFIPELNKLPDKCSDCGKKITSAYGKNPEWVAAYTYKTYGKVLCAECAAKLKAKQESQKAPDIFGDVNEQP